MYWNEVLAHNFIVQNMPVNTHCDYYCHMSVKCFLYLIALAKNNSIMSYIYNSYCIYIYQQDAILSLRCTGVGFK